MMSGRILQIRTGRIFQMVLGNFFPKVSGMTSRRENRDIPASYFNQADGYYISLRSVKSRLGLL